MMVTSQLQAHLAARRWSQEVQRDVAGLVFCRREPYERALLAIRNGRMLFSEPHLMALQRMIVLHAGKRPTSWRFESDAQTMLYERALVSMFAFTQSGVNLVAPGEDRSWLAYLTRNGAYNSRDTLSELIAQVYAFFVELPSAMRNHAQHVPIDQWFAEDYNGLGPVEQFAAGLFILATSGSLDASAGVRRSAVLDEGAVSQIAGRLSCDAQCLDEILVGDREWYRDEFAADDDEDSAAWNRVPFEKRPLMRLPSGAVVMTSPQALQRWMTEGLFHRAIDSARRRRREARFRQFYAAMVERYVLDLMREAHPGPRRLGVGTVHGEHQSKAGIHSPDVAIDFGPDLVLMEVVSKRLTLNTTVRGDPEAVAKDLERMIAQKMRQLSARISNLRAGQSSIPGIDMACVDRVWPVIVVPGGILQNPHLWAFLTAQAPDCFRQPGTQHPAIVDLADVETLASLIEAGHCLPDVLRMKLEGYARRDLASFVVEDHRVGSQPRSKGLQRRFDSLWDRVFTALGFDSERGRHDRQAHASHRHAA